MVCRFCFDSGDEPLISPCACKGSQQWIHESCLSKWYNMKVENRVCSVCKYDFIVQQLAPFEFVAPHLGIYISAPLTNGFIAMFYNWMTLLLLAQIVPTHWIRRDPDFFYACFQCTYYIFYTLFVWKRYISLIHNKAAYWRALSNDGKQMLLMQGVPILGLFFVKNNIYQLSAVFTSCFAQQPFLYYHYMALRDVNAAIQWRFRPFLQPASSS